MPEAPPLDPTAIEIHAVQFVGTNVEMTYLVDAPDDEATARLEALFAAKLGLHAITPTGHQPAVDGRERSRFSVIASPLERLFHKIGPPVALTIVKHASLTLDLSEVNLARQGQGLLRTHPELDAATPETWPAWDVGKLLGTLLRRPALLETGPVQVAGIAVLRGAFPDALLPVADGANHAHGGLPLAIPPELRTSLGAL
jgi:hypothetical protein